MVAELIRLEACRGAKHTIQTTPWAEDAVNLKFLGTETRLGRLSISLRKRSSQIS
ncbi:hypothetical protein MY11210_008014 [Beauveria gryllotalpidicola]